MSEIYIAVAILGLGIIAGVPFLSRTRKQQPLSILAAVSLLFVVAGAALGDDRPIAYSLMGTGVVLAVIDMILKTRKETPPGSPMER